MLSICIQTHQNCLYLLHLFLFIVCFSLFYLSSYVMFTAISLFIDFMFNTERWIRLNWQVFFHKKNYFLKNFLFIMRRKLVEHSVHWLLNCIQPRDNRNRDDTKINWNNWIIFRIQIKYTPVSNLHEEII